MKDVANWNEGDWIAAIAAIGLFAFLAAGAAIAARRDEQVLGPVERSIVQAGARQERGVLFRLGFRVRFLAARCLQLLPAKLGHV